MVGDLTEIEICDICGKETSEFSIIDGLVVCNDCKENFELKENEDFSSNVCSVCGWPINRVISKEDARKFVEGVEKWLKKENLKNESLFKALNKLKRKEHYLCRYDFFELIKNIIENFDKNVARKFEKEIFSQYDFFGSLIS